MFLGSNTLILLVFQEFHVWLNLTVSWCSSPWFKQDC